MEHTASSPSVVTGGAQAYTSQLQYEGFEPSPYETDDNRAQLELMAMVREQYPTLILSNLSIYYN